VWSITLTNGQPVATFTPEKDYHGPVTDQPYTITDTNGMTATGTLGVTITTPPTTPEVQKATDVPHPSSDPAAPAGATINTGGHIAGVSNLRWVAPSAAGVFLLAVGAVLFWRRRSSTRA